MKRLSSGTRKKQGAGTRKPAVRRSPTRTTTKTSKSTPQKRVRATKAEAAAPPQTVKKKAARKKVATRKIARKKSVAPGAEAEVIVPSIRPKKARTIASKKKVTAKKKASAKKKTLRSALAASTPDAPPAPPAARTKSLRLRKAVTRPVRRAPRLTEPALPAFLFEGDETSHPEVSGPGEKFSLGPTAPLDHFDEAKAPLPESYGTGKLFLTARDPHWLYAHWDLTREEQFRHNARSVDRHLVLRVFDTAQPDQTVAECHVHPESKHWFVHVEQAGHTYQTELGYYQRNRQWKSLAFSAPQSAPPDNISADTEVEFATIPLELSFETMLALLRESIGEAEAERVPLAHGIEHIRSKDFPAAMPIGDWTNEQEMALAEMLAVDRARATLPSSEEFVTPEGDIPWPEFQFDFASGAAAAAPAPSSYVSSFFGGAGPKDFWFNVNAELIIYGATEPDATVTFAGKQIALQPDGSFRFRFALPDGTYELPVVAVSADGTDGRAAELKFGRATELRGAVGAAPQDPELPPPPNAK